MLAEGMLICGGPGFWVSSIVLCHETNWYKSMSELSLLYGRLKGPFGIICGYFPSPMLYS